MGDVRKNTIAFACGVKGSGKSSLIRDAFTSQSPRVLTLEFTRWEALDFNPDAIQCIGLKDLLTKMQAVAPAESWHLVAAIEEEDVPALFAVLAPRITQGGGYAVAVGGMAVECGECDIIAPVSYVTPEVSNAFKRGRHYGLSLFMGTQRAHECARIVTAQADHVIIFRQHEPRDVEYLRQAVSKPIAEYIPSLPEHWHLWHEKATGRVYLRDAARRTRRVLTTWGQRADQLPLSLSDGGDDDARPDVSDGDDLVGD